MSQQSLSTLKCSACEGTEAPLTPDQYDSKLRQLDGWKVQDEIILTKSYQMDDFSAVIKFVNTVAELAEAEGHHPDLHITGYNKLRIDLTTHAISGLSVNDFIMAAKIDQIDTSAGQ